jgi:membrane-associated protein
MHHSIHLGYQFAYFLKSHELLAYLFLFLGSYIETLIGISFFIYGELFFLIGSTLAGRHALNIWFVAASLIAGGILGDSTTYFIGRKLGSKIFKLNRRLFNPENYERGKKLFDKYGTKAIFFGRLVGPLSWIMPFLSGVYKIPYTKFITYNIPGVIFGIGQFILIGYFFGHSFPAFTALLEKHFGETIFIVLVLIICFALFKDRIFTLLSKLRSVMTIFARKNTFIYIVIGIAVFVGLLLIFT